MKHGTTKTLNVGCILLLIFLFCALALLPQRVRAETATTTINVGSSPLGMAIAPNGAIAYVTNEVSGTVSVIDTVTNTVTASVTVGSNPWDVAVTPNGADVYVTNEGSDSVSEISTTSNTVTRTITGFFSNPYGVAVTPNGAYAYVTNFGGDTVSVINTATNALVTSVTVGSHPYDVAITPNGNYAYVTNQGSQSVSVINTATNALVTSVNVGSGSYGVAITPNGNYAYVTIAASNTVWGISTATNTVTAAITGLSDPQNVAATPNSAYALVTNVGSNTVWVISTTTNTLTTTVTGLSSPWDVAVTPNGAYAYVTNEGGDTVSVIKVLVAPTVMSSPSTVDQSQNSSLTSSLVTTGTPSYAYQWFEEAPGAGSSYLAISGATLSSYSFATTGSTTTGVWSFELEVIDSSGERLNSSNAFVTVNAVPSVSISPGSASLDVGQVQVFTASASGGTGDLTYQWYLDGGDVGTNSTSYSYTAAGTSHSVTCEVTDSASTPVTSASNMVTVTVALFPIVSITPVGPISLDAGQSQGFTAIAGGGSGTIYYQWYLDGSAVLGAIASTYSFSESAGSYSVTCEATDSASTPVTSPASTAVSLTVNSALVAPTTPASAGTVDQGQTSSLTSATISTGTSPYSYQWLEKAPGANSYSSISGATSFSYSFVTTDSASTGTWSFKLQVTDNVGEQATSSATSVTVNAFPSVSVSSGSASLDVGQPATFTATASGGSGIYSSYQWYVNGFAQSDQTASTFSYSPASAGTYSVTVTVTDSLGETSTQSTATTVTASVTVTPTPTPITPIVTPTLTPPSLSTPTPNNTPLPSQNPTTSPNQNQPETLLQATIYGITAAVAIVAIFVVVLVLKKIRKGKVKETPAT